MVSAPHTNTPFLSQTLAQLRELAKRLGVRSYAQLAKVELVEVLAQSGPEPAGAHPSLPTAAEDFCSGANHHPGNVPAQ